MLVIFVSLAVLLLIGAWLLARRLLRDPNVVARSSNDLLLAQAAVEARSKLDRFKSKLEAKEGEYFSVKIPILIKDDWHEHIWVEDLEFEGENWRGKLANKPVHLKGMKLGSPVEFPESDIEDWLMLQDEQVEGLFSKSVFS